MTKSTTPSTRLALSIDRQPDDRTCGPTCLQAVYRYFGDERPLESLVEGIPQLESGGTLAVQLGCHALRSGYDATIVSYNLQLFDPTWFEPNVDLQQRLTAQVEARRDDARLVHATEKYIEFLTLGGHVVHSVLRPRLVHRFLAAGLPVLTGLSATYLYQTARELPDLDRPDDIRGDPVGHFVVLCGDDLAERTVCVADPWRRSQEESIRTLPFDRVASAILLGVLTYDANLLVVHPKDKPLP